VETRKEFVEAINSFTGAIMIYDGHGAKGYNEYGFLPVGMDEVNLWEMRGMINLPPIVLLSACDTHPLDASHASTANGFLSAGANTVLATLLPIDGIDSAIFMARLIRRIEYYMPSIINYSNMPLRWIKVISGLQRMVYVTDLFRSLLIVNNIPMDSDIFTNTIIQTNIIINSGYSDWYERSLKIIAEQLSKDIDEIKSFVKREFFPDCLKYIQMGNPEMILIHKK